MRRLHVSGAKYRTVRGGQERRMPSRFLDELGREGVVRSDQSDDPGAGGWGDAGERDFDRGAAVLGDLERVREARRKLSTITDEYRARYPVGSLVRHPQFGLGKVLSVDGGRHARARVEFRDAGTKTLVLEYARLTRVGD